MVSPASGFVSVPSSNRMLCAVKFGTSSSAPFKGGAGEVREARSPCYPTKVSRDRPLVRRRSGSDRRLQMASVRVRCDVALVNGRKGSCARFPRAWIKCGVAFRASIANRRTGCKNLSRSERNVSVALCISTGARGILRRCSRPSISGFQSKSYPTRSP